MSETLMVKMRRRMDRNKAKGDDRFVGTTVRDILLVELLGEGGMGKVYLGYDTELERKVAVKVLDEQEFPSPEDFAVRKRYFIREAKALAKADHPGVVTVHFIEGIYIVMEYVEGVELGTMLKKASTSRSGLGFKYLVLSILQMMANALRTAHSNGVVHKDLKPANIMIVQDPVTGKYIPKIIDFGLAGNMKELNRGHGERVEGTPSYMAPEQADDKWDQDAGVDVFAIGAMAYGVLMGEPYYTGATAMEILAQARDPQYLETRIWHLPPEQYAFFKSLLAYDPKERARGMLEVNNAINTLRFALRKREMLDGVIFPKVPEQQQVPAVTSEASDPALVEHAFGADEFHAAREESAHVDSSPGGTMLQFGPPKFAAEPTAGVEPAQIISQEPTSFSVNLSSLTNGDVSMPSPSPVLASFGALLEQKKSRKWMILFIALNIMVGVGVTVYLFGDFRGAPLPATSTNRSVSTPMADASVQVAFVQQDASAAMDAALQRDASVVPDATVQTDASVVIDAAPSRAPPTLAEQMVKLHDAREIWCKANDEHRAKFGEMWTFHLACHYRYIGVLQSKKKHEVAVLYAQKVHKRFCTNWRRMKFHERSLKRNCNFLLARYHRSLPPLHIVSRAKYKLYRQWMPYQQWYSEQRRKRKRGMR